MSLRRTDHSSRGVLPTVVRRWVWSRNLVNEEAQAHWGAVTPGTKKKTYDLTMGFLFQHLHSRNKWLTKKHGTLFLLRSSDCQECPVLEVRISFRNSRYCTTCISADTFQIHSFTTSFNITFPPTSAFHSDLFHSDFPTELCKHSSSLPLVRHCSTKVNH